MEYINEAKRFQKLAGIINEAEIQTDPVADKDAEQGLKQALSILQTDIKTIKPTEKTEDLDESLLLTAVVSAPEIIKIAGKAVNVISSLFQKDKKKGTVVGNALKKWGKKLEHQYILGLANIITKLKPGLYDNQDPLDENTALYDAAHGLYAAIIAATALGTGMELAGAHSVASSAVEGSALLLKKSEVEKLIQKIQSKPAIS